MVYCVFLLKVPSRAAELSSPGAAVFCLLLHSVGFLASCQLIGCRLVAESHGAIRAVALPPYASAAQLSFFCFVIYI